MLFVEKQQLVTLFVFGQHIMFSLSAHFARHPFLEHQRVESRPLAIEEMEQLQTRHSLVVVSSVQLMEFAVQPKTDARDFSPQIQDSPQDQRTPEKSPVCVARVSGQRVPIFQVQWLMHLVLFQETFQLLRFPQDIVLAVQEVFIADFRKVDDLVLIGIIGDEVDAVGLVKLPVMRQRKTVFLLFERQEGADFQLKGIFPDHFMQPQVHALQLCGQDGRLFFRIENDFPLVDEIPAEYLQCVDQKPFKFSEIALFIVDDFFISDPQIQADIQFLQVLDGQIGVGVLRCGGNELIRLDFRQ